MDQYKELAHKIADNKCYHPAIKGGHGRWYCEKCKEEITNLTEAVSLAKAAKSLGGVIKDLFN